MAGTQPHCSPRCGAGAAGQPIKHLAHPRLQPRVQEKRQQALTLPPPRGMPSPVSVMLLPPLDGTPTTMYAATAAERAEAIAGGRLRGTHTHVSMAGAG